jgi:GNAT superfamily N-acetyltransferase
VRFPLPDRQTYHFSISTFEIAYSIPAIRAPIQSEPSFWQESWREDVLDRGLEASGGLSFVWEESGQILGFICAHDLGFRGYISELIVKSSERGRGVATGLVEKVQQKLVSAGCAVLISDVWRDAEEFYKSMGWTEPDVKLLRKRLLQ